MDTKALRQKILDLAIRGKLVPQDPNDEPASVLLERIRVEKQQMVKEGKLKPKDIKNDTIIFVGEDNLHYEKFQDGSVKCIEDEIPFEVPEGWAWCRLKHVCTMAAGKAKPTDQIMTEPFEGCYPCFGGNGIRGYVDEYNQDGIFSIVGRQGALCGNINIAKGKFYATEHAVVTTLFSGIDFNWSNYVLEALQLNSYATGAAQPGLSVANVLNVFAPVPPTQEQVHIGIRISESIKIIENIEDEKENLQTLISSAKSKILDLAIRGKLVPQNSNDEPASVLLERIRAEKEELIKAGKIKRDKKESIIFKGDDNSYYEKIGNEVHCIDEDIPFKIPHNWIWCRMSSISDIIMGTSPKGTSICENPQYTEFHQGKIYFSDMLIKNSGQYTRELTKIAKPNSILLCVRAPVGEVNLTDRKICIGRGLASISPLGAVSRYFMLYWIKAFRETLIKKATGTTFVAVTTDVVKGLLLPIPPLAEQYRITNKIQSLVENLIYIEKSLR